MYAQCPACMIPTGNLVVNGDFSQGNKGFTSDYGNQKDLVPEAMYYVTNDANLTHYNFRGTDHTTTKGSFMVVNGSYVANSSVWCQTISVKPHVIYSFSTWLCSVSVGNPASLQFSINGVNLATPFSAPNSLYTWIQFFQWWDSGNDTVAKICIVNQNTVRGGNDFGLDDISFATCAPKAGIKVDLGPDQNICIGQTLKLSAGAGSDAYLWSDGSTDSFIYINSVGTYWVQVTKDSCVGSDTMRILNAVAPPKVGLGNDTFLCSGTYTLDASNPAFNRKWSTGDTTQQIVVSQTGTYWVKVGNNGCSDSDGIHIDIHNIPHDYLGNDTTLCKEDSILLDATQNNHYTYLWEDGSNSSKRYISSSGIYYIQWQILTCNYYDTIQIGFVAPPKVYIGPDTTLCAGDSLWLDAQNMGLLHLWNTGDTSQQIMVRQTGNYKVIVSNGYCSVSDQAYAKFSLGPPIALKDYYTICTETNDLLTLYPGHAASYFWQPSGSTDSSISIIIPPQHITLKVTDARGCTNTKDIKVEELCGPRLFVPNAFTPNNNHVNDVFLPKGKFVLSFQMEIYNRWGEKIFEAKDVNQGWDGYFKGKRCAEDIYMYLITYGGQGPKGPEMHDIKGVFYLLP